MIEIKFSKKKKKKGNKPMKSTHNSPKQKMETSKKLAWFSGICFAIAILYSMLVASTTSDYAMLITLITVTGAVFGVTMATYMNKGRYENTVKIQKGFLREKYTILKDLGVLDNSRAIQEMEEEFAEIENDFDNEKSMANQEITYNG